MLFESAITKSSEDVFERLSFAGHIAELLVLKPSSPSLVLALEGKWGSGKTSLINLIKLSIKNDCSNAVIVDFNPWLIGSLDSVIEGFLVQLASSINQTLNSEIATKAASRILNFAKFLAPIKLIPGVEPWGTVVETVLTTVGSSTQAAVDMTKLDLNLRKMAVEESLGDIGKPIIVFIDDIDRLPPDEIRIVIQVVKAIANFNRVSYLLAYEPEPVVRSLQYNGIYDGNRYLEKIVQAAYPIPRIGYWHLKGFFRNHISEMLTRLELKTTDVENELLNEALDTTAIVRALSTPRDVIRLMNRLTITAKNTWGEVNFADMVAFETLELKYPKISNTIRNTPELFLKLTVLEGDYITQDHLDDMLNDTQNDEPPFVKELLAEFDGIQTRNIRSILSFIFPKLLSKWEHISPEDALSQNRICTREALLKLLHSGPNRYIFSTEEIKHFVLSETDRKEILLDHLQSGSIVTWLPYLNQFIINLEVANPVSLCSLMIDICNVAFKEYNQELVDSASIPILSLLSKSEQRKDIVRLLMSNEHSLSLSEHVMLRLLSRCHMWRDGIYNGMTSYSSDVSDPVPFTPEELVEEKNVWLTTARKVMVNTNILVTEPEPISILFRLAQLNENDFAEVKEYVDNIANDHERLRLFVQCFHGGKGLSGIEKLIKDIPSFIDRVEQAEIVNKRMISYLRAVEKGETPPD